MPESKKQNFLRGAAILTAASLFARLLGALFRIPVFNILDDAGAGAYQATYQVYMVILSISTAGVPVALSRLISSANATGKTGLVKRYFSVALPAFALLGLVLMVVMFTFAESFARFIGTSYAAPGIRVLAPAVFFAGIVSVYRGYAQGFENMIPTAMSQAAEAFCRMAFGVAIAMMLDGRGYASEIVSAGSVTGVTIGLAVCIPILMYYRGKINRTLALQVSDNAGAPGKKSVLKQILKVSVPITLGSSFMAVVTLITTSVLLGRLQHGLGLSETAASGYFGQYTRALTIFNLPTAVIVPMAVTIVPAIAEALANKRRGMATTIMQSSVKIVNMIAMPAAAGMVVLASPIMIALYNDTREIPATILTILGAASFFVCFQLVTTAILQANGHERITMVTLPIGGTLQIAINYVLVGNPNIGIIGSAVGVLVCFAVVCVLNVAFIVKRVKERPKFVAVMLRPLLCAAVMALAAYSTYGLLFRVGSSMLGGGRFAVIVCLAASILVAAVVYLVLIIVTRTITREDMKLIPKGEKLANFLRIK